MSFEVGDKVIDVRLGEGVVIGNDDLVQVLFENRQHPDKRTQGYTQDGKIARTDTLPLLYHAKGFTPPSCKEPERKPKCQFKPFDRVLVIDPEDKDDVWTPDIVSYVDESGQIWCIGSGWAVAENVILYEGNEDKAGKVKE